MIAVCRPYGGITINEEVEYLLDDHDEVMEFASIDKAKEYLVEHGVTEFDYLKFVEV